MRKIRNYAVCSGLSIQMFCVNTGQRKNHLVFLTCYKKGVFFSCHHCKGHFIEYWCPQVIRFLCNMPESNRFILSSALDTYCILCQNSRHTNTFVFPLTLYMMINFAYFFVVYFFFQSNYFKKILSGIPS